MQTATQEVSYVYFGYGRDLASEVRRVVGLATNVPQHDAIRIFTNGPLIFLPAIIAHRTSREGDTTGIPEEVFGMKSALDISLGMLSMAPWENLYFVNVYDNYMILPKVYNEIKFTLLLQGVVKMESGRKVERMEVVKVLNCRYLDSAKVCVDGTGHYLCVIEIYLGVEQVMLGESLSYVARVQDSAPAFIQWKINGELTHTTPLKDIDFEEVNTLNIVVKDEANENGLGGVHQNSTNENTRANPF